MYQFHDTNRSLFPELFLDSYFLRFLSNKGDSKKKKKMAFVDEHPICEKVKNRLPAAAVAWNKGRVL